MAVAPRLSDLKETALYVEDLDRAKRFYRTVMGLEPLVDEQRFCAFDVSGKHILLLFIRGGSTNPTELPGGTIPSHDGAGALHIAFSIAAADLSAWEAHLAAHAVDIQGRVQWPRGGTSVYFRDPDGNLLELLTPGVWKTY
jgi:catechol 2,3-dioxygenase-like lactoylglutathione lyase family enzyme